MQKSKSGSRRRTIVKKTKPVSRAGKAGKRPQKQPASFSRLKKAKKSNAIKKASRRTAHPIRAKITPRAQPGRAMEAGAVKFATLKNYPTSKSYEVVGRKTGFFDGLFARLGMKK